MNTSLIPDWDILNKIPSELKSSPEQKTAVQIRAGLSYFCLRLALNGWSSFVVTNEDRAEIFSKDVKSFQSFFKDLKEWSAGYFPEESSKDRTILLEDAVQSKGILWCGTANSLVKNTFSKAEFLNSRVELKVGKVLAYSKFLKELSEKGYSRTGFVEEVGEFACRGEIVDFWSPNSSKPIRLVFLNDVIESLHFFESDTQRASTFVSETVLLPVSEKEVSGSVIKHFPSDTILIVERLLLEDPSFRTDNFQLPVVEISSMGIDSGLELPVPVRLNWNFFKEELGKNVKKGFSNFVFCRNMGESQRLEDILDELRCRGDERPQILVAPISQGFVNESLKLSVWSFGDLVGFLPPVRRISKFKMGRSLDAISDIRMGDYVVHEQYGIGRYRGLERVSLRIGARFGKKFLNEKESEFLVLEYRGGDRLFVSIEDFRLVQKYVGSEGKRPHLYSLDRASWERVKEKVRKEVAELAQSLLKTAAVRATTLRSSEHASVQSNESENLYREFVDAFPYEETPDQIKAIQEIEKDLGAPYLMDRLVCGDVGYGKTEIAMRAAFNVVCNSKQAVVLVPTTILAEQHFKNFSERFAAFPVRIAMISRFQKPLEQKKILVDLKAGLIDIIIGTHRLLQKDVHFKNLGLIVIDEEHRFGVEQKESLKKMKLTADVLALSATPIPRTLSFSFGGVKAISVIETPPEGRLPIETFVGLFDEQKLGDAIKREVSRGGQIFYVHNRVETIESRKHFLEKLFPNLKIGLAHGQMTGTNLEKAMWNFLSRKWDILLSTSIIESGLDIPSVNTLVIEDSEEFGLAQLYQLRGRVGRQREKAYCYLFFSDWSSLSTDARKRLDAIQEFSALGSGMKLAIRDLEIRGMGNLLGPQQHGWISAVGLELYCQLLSEEVKHLKEREGIRMGIEVERPEIPLPEVSLNVSAFIPEQYVESPGERISLYKKMISCRTMDALEKLESEMSDRFGHVPGEVRSLLRIVRLKILAYEVGLLSISETEEGIIFSWARKNEEIPLDIVRFAKDFPDLIEILPPDLATKDSGNLRILFKEGIGEEIITAVENFLHISVEYVILKK